MHMKPTSDLFPVDTELEKNTKELKESQQSRKSNHGR